MTNWFIMCIWLGGVFAALEREKRIGETFFWALFNAVLWPFNLGYEIAHIYYKTDHEIFGKKDDKQN